PVMTRCGMEGFAPCRTASFFTRCTDARRAVLRLLERPALADDLLLHVARHRVVVAELGVVEAAALRHRAERRRVAVELGLGDLRDDLLERPFGLHPLHARAPRVEIAEDI